MVATYLIQEGPNPTADFYFADRDPQYDLLLESKPSQYTFTAQDTLIFIRYISADWLAYLKKLTYLDLPDLIFFIDDDVFDRKMHVGLPWRYRWKLYHLAVRHQKQLKRQGFKLWVSTPWLQQKYQQWQPVLRPPQNPYRQQKQSKDIIFYHGTASHQAEIEWLLPVFEKVLAANNQLTIELIGGEKTRRLFKGVDAVHVYHPMSWHSYKELISTPGRIIGLAPLLETPFNQARSASKFFDITHAGAVGIYADTEVYRHKITHLENGLLLPMEQEVWVENILFLLSNKKLLQVMIFNSKNIYI